MKNRNSIFWFYSEIMPMRYKTITVKMGIVILRLLKMFLPKCQLCLFQVIMNGWINSRFSPPGSGFLWLKMNLIIISIISGSETFYLLLSTQTFIILILINKKKSLIKCRVFWKSLLNIKSSIDFLWTTGLLFVL